MFVHDNKLHKLAHQWLLYIKDFIYETGCEEPNLKKQAKFDKLILSDDEWALVKLVVELLGVNVGNTFILILIYNNFLSSLTVCNKHFHITTPPPFTPAFQLLRLCTKPGAAEPRDLNTRTSLRHWMLLQNKLRSIMRRLPPLMHILLWCVSAHFLFP